jgi:hypothetical protein
MTAWEFAADARPAFVRADKKRTNGPVPSTRTSPIPVPQKWDNATVYVRSDRTDVTRRIRASRVPRELFAMKHTTTNTHDADATTRRLVVILREVLATQRIESIPDLTEALKCRCGQLRVPWTNASISEAYRLLESNQRLPLARAPQTSAVRPLRAHDYIPRLSHAEASALVRRLLDVTRRTLRAMR